MNLQETSKAKGASDLRDVQLNPEFIEAFCKILIKNFGERRALAAVVRMMGPEQSLRELKEFFSKEKSASEPDDVGLKVLESACEFWENLVKDVGERQAKHIMQIVMDNKKVGRHGDLPMFVLIFCYIRIWGLHELDEKIAKRIFENKPHYVHFESGNLWVVDDWMTEERILWDKTIVERTPINKGIPTIKKQVERVRRWLIEEKILPKEYAPKTYYHG